MMGHNVSFFASRNTDKDLATFTETVKAAMNGSKPTAAPATSAPDPMDQLRKLGELRDAGVLTPEEFDSKKADLLARM